MRKLTPEVVGKATIKALKAKQLSVFDDHLDKANVTLTGRYNPIVAALDDDTRKKIAEGPANSFHLSRLWQWTRFCEGPDTKAELALLRGLSQSYDSLMGAVRQHGKGELGKKRETRALDNFADAVKACVGKRASDDK